jgi:DtxR family Mn-dependent transcriptional regulator
MGSALILITQNLDRVLLEICGLSRALLRLIEIGRFDRASSAGKRVSGLPDSHSRETRAKRKNVRYNRTLMPSSTVENYVKQIYVEQQTAGGEQLVPMGKLAAAMGVVPGTATSMIQALAKSGLVEYEPRTGVRLTKGGEQLALHVLRRHRLVELLLVQVLGLDWSEVHDEAEELEHVISDKVLERIDALLGHPSADPHGDPIPSARGTVPRLGFRPLSECPPGFSGKVARVVDQDAAFLQFVERCGLKPGVSITVEAQDTLADAVTVRPGKGLPVTLGSGAAGKLLVEDSFST